MYTYADGNNNEYRLTAAYVQYDPVEPRHSSSGEYSGGDFKKTEITEKEFADAAALLEQALGDTSAHTEHRVKGSGLLCREGGSEVMCAILIYKSARQEAVEAALNHLLYSR